jgi:septal ring factor EnvC (AmiA/AmiB activator)
MFNSRLKVFALAAVTALTLVGGLAHAPAAQAADYPSWDQIQQAQQSTAATQQEISVVQGTLSQLNADVTTTSARAQSTQNALSAAQAKLAYALSTYLGLQQRADAARASAKTAKQQAGRVVAAMSRTQGSGIGMTTALPGANVDATLSQYSALAWIGDRNQRILTQAQAEERTATSLSDQAKSAQQVLNAQTSALAQQVNEAQQAQQDAQNALAAQQQHAAELTAQLGTLQNQTAQLIAQRQAGIAAELAAQRAAQAAVNAHAAPTSVTTASANTGGSRTAAVPATTSWTPAAAQATGQAMAAARGWSGSQWSALLSLWNKESGWRVNASNPSSGAYGIPQSLPGGKMASAGGDWQTNAATQIAWGLSYIASSYGSPANAWAHSQATNWY